MMRGVAQRQNMSDSCRPTPVTPPVRETLEAFLARGGRVERVYYPRFEDVRIPTAREAMLESMRICREAAYRRSQERGGRK